MPNGARHSHRSRHARTKSPRCEIELILSVQSGVPLQFCQVVALVVTFIERHAKPPNIAAVNLAESFLCERLATTVEAAGRSAKGEVWTIRLIESTNALGMFPTHPLNFGTGEIRFDLPSTLAQHFCAIINATRRDVSPRSSGDFTSVRNRERKQNVAIERFGPCDLARIDIWLTGETSGIDEKCRLVLTQEVDQERKSRVIELRTQWCGEGIPRCRNASAKAEPMYPDAPSRAIITTVNQNR